jgi:hypothetical protein
MRITLYYLEPIAVYSGSSREINLGVYRVKLEILISLTLVLPRLAPESSIMPREGYSIELLFFRKVQRVTILV